VVGSGIGPPYSPHPAALGAERLPGEAGCGKIAGAVRAWDATHRTAQRRMTMTHGSEPRPDPWRKDDAGPTAAQPVPGPFPAPTHPAGPTPGWPGVPGPTAYAGYPAVDPDAPAWARQAHAQGAHQPPPAGYVQPVFPPTAQQQPYQQPGYVPAGYLPGPYAGGYPGGPRGPVKPGVITGAAVLGFVQAGLLVIAGLVSFAGARVLADLDVWVDGPGLLTVLGVLSLVAAGLLIAGGVTVHHRRPGLLIAGCGVSLALSLWWMVLLTQGSAELTLPLVFATMPIISLSLVLSAAARAWFRSGAASR
jgi:hypothetical protein